jgi:hypothetical protein
VNDLETLLADAAKRGLTHLSLHPVPSADNKTVYWCARATPSTGHHYVSAERLDPCEALAQALHDLPRAPKRAAKKENQGTLPIDAIPGKETEDGAVTAAVKPAGFEDFLPKP